MSKKRDSLAVSENLNGIFSVKPVKERDTVEGFPIEKALNSVVRQMEIAGNRPRTISDYELYVTKFAEVTGVQVLEEINIEHIYAWLSSMNVSNQTKLTRLKCIKAFLSRCFYNGWMSSNFWRQVNVKVNTPVKEGATEKDVMLLLSFLDLKEFIELRDATFILLMYQTGLRVKTVAQLENKHVIMSEKLLKVDGGLLKNHENIYLPFDETLARLFTALMNQNSKVRAECRMTNEKLFITQQGEGINIALTNNFIQKRLNKYSREYGLKNMNPHALRRGFAKRLLKKGANLAEISKALGHSDLAVTTRYLHMDKSEVAENLRKYL